jgi:hypothetical protein
MKPESEGEVKAGKLGIFVLHFNHSGLTALCSRKAVPPLRATFGSLPRTFPGAWFSFQLCLPVVPDQASSDLLILRLLGLRLE